MKVLRLRFSTVDGSSFVLSLRNPKEGLTASEVEDLAEVILGLQPFAVELLELADARVVEQSVSELI